MELANGFRGVTGETGVSRHNPRRGKSREMSATRYAAPARSVPSGKHKVDGIGLVLLSYDLLSNESAQITGRGCFAGLCFD